MISGSIIKFSHILKKYGQQPQKHHFLINNLSPTDKPEIMDFILLY